MKYGYNQAKLSLNHFLAAHLHTIVRESASYRMITKSCDVYVVR